jgi:uncharacterized membrane protein YuzA (DUF378 family)
MVTQSLIGSVQIVNQQVRGFTSGYCWRMAIYTTIGLAGVLCGLVFGACGTDEQSDPELKRQDLSIINPKRCKGSGSMNASTPFC